MFEGIIWLLIYICCIVGVAYVVEWVVTALLAPHAIPPKGRLIFWIVVGLIVLLLLFRMLGPLVRGI